jgi:hypothetical protein
MVNLGPRRWSYPSVRSSRDVDGGLSRCRRQRDAQGFGRDELGLDLANVRPGCGGGTAIGWRQRTDLCERSSTAVDRRAETHHQTKSSGPLGTRLPGDAQAALELKGRSTGPSRHGTSHPASTGIAHPADGLMQRSAFRGWSLTAGVFVCAVTLGCDVRTPGTTLSNCPAVASGARSRSGAGIASREVPVSPVPVRPLLARNCGAGRSGVPVR